MTSWEVRSSQEVASCGVTVLTLPFYNLLLQTRENVLLVDPQPGRQPGSESSCFEGPSLTLSSLFLLLYFC